MHGNLFCCREISGLAIKACKQNITHIDSGRNEKLRIATFSE